MDSVGVRPCRNVWMLSFVVLCSRVRSQCQLLQSLLFSLIFCFINIGHRGFPM
jgi:hypothetical protein